LLDLKKSYDQEENLAVSNRRRREIMAAERSAAERETLRILREAHAVLENDHFVYDSGEHGSGWIDKDAIYPHTRRTQRLCRDLAAAAGPLNAEVVCGPATGGLIVAQWTAHSLDALAIFGEHDRPAGDALVGQFVLRRGYDRLAAGRRVLVVDDVVNTGLSLRQMVDAVRQAGGEVVGAAALVTRGNAGAAGIGVAQFLYLLEYDIPSWPAAECPLCRDGVPVNTHYAHGRDFLAAQEGRG
jgi:orotate phosphoribosyltransferase